MLITIIIALHMLFNSISTQAEEEKKTYEGKVEFPMVVDTHTKDSLNEWIDKYQGLKSENKKDIENISKTKSELGKKQLESRIESRKQKAYEVLKRILESKEKSVQIKLQNTLVPSGEETYQNTKNYILSEIRDLYKDLSTGELLKTKTMGIDIEAKSVWEKMQERLLTESPDKLLKEAYPHLMTKVGFEMFNAMGDLYLERGDLEKALKIWNEAREYSVGYASLNNEKRLKFLNKLAFTHKRAQKLDEFEAMLMTSENSELIKFVEGELVRQGLDELQSTLTAMRPRHMCSTDEEKDNEEDKDVKIEMPKKEKPKACKLIESEINNILKLSGNENNPTVLSNAVEHEGKLTFIVQENDGDSPGKILKIIEIDKDTGNINFNNVMAKIPEHEKAMWEEHTYNNRQKTLSFKNGKYKYGTRLTSHEIDSEGNTIAAQRGLNINLENDNQPLTKNCMFNSTLVTNLIGEKLKENNPKKQIIAARAITKEMIEKNPEIEIILAKAIDETKSLQFKVLGLEVLKK